jgi:hypothetical protein
MRFRCCNMPKICTRHLRFVQDRSQLEHMPRVEVRLAWATIRSLQRPPFFLAQQERCLVDPTSSLAQHGGEHNRAYMRSKAGTWGCAGDS